MNDCICLHVLGTASCVNVQAVGQVISILASYCEDRGRQTEVRKWQLAILFTPANHCVTFFSIAINIKA